MPRAFCLIRGEPVYRRWAFEAGLKAAGFEVHGAARAPPNRDDVLVIWNRYGRFQTEAQAFERAGARVIVAENGVFGRDWRGAHWYSIARNFPAAVGGGYFHGGPERWDSWSVELCGWRNSGKEVIVLGQRGIGPTGAASPTDWHRHAVERLRRLTSRPIRVRSHPGEGVAKELEEDLAEAHCVVTWASNAALKAVLLGVPVFYDFGGWCGLELGQMLAPTTNIEQPARTDRLSALRRLAWTTYNTDEIATGEPFVNLLGSRSTASPSTIAAS